MPFSRASRSSPSRKSGWAIEISASPRCRSDRPKRFTAPYSVTTQCTWPRVVTTPAPAVSVDAMRETLPPAAVDGSAAFERADAALYRAKDAGRNLCIAA